MTDEKPTPHWRKLKLFLSHKDPLNKAEVRKLQANDASIEKQTQKRVLTPTADILKTAKTSFPKRKKSPITGDWVRATTGGNKANQYTNFEVDEHFSTEDNTTLTKNIRFVRMWFQYLKLCLEVEKHSLQIKNNDQYFKVNRNIYRDWDLEQVETMSFNDWFPIHKHLFILDPIEIVSNLKAVPKDSILLSIPKSATMLSAKRALVNLLEDKLAATAKTTFSFHDSRTPFLSLHIEYNLLVMAFNKNRREQMMNIMNDRYSHLPEARMKKPKTVNNQETDKIVLENLFSRTQAVTRKIMDGKSRMKYLCDGIFPYADPHKKKTELD